MRGPFASSARWRNTRQSVWICTWTCLALHGCATIPTRSIGVHSLEVAGVERLDEEALMVCLVTQARERLVIPLGAAGDPECGVPPFDASRLPIKLWAWPFTDWPLYDEAVFDRDLSRVLRWYKARGFYAARIASVERKPDETGRKIDLALRVEEGDPTLVEKLELRGVGDLDADTLRAVQNALELKPLERFDEALYDASKRGIVAAVREASYAKASVEGSVLIDPARKRARVVFTVTLGRRFRFGKVSVEGQGNLPQRPVLGAAALENGAAFSVSALDDAKRAIYELGPFASVELIEHAHATDDTIDIVIKVVPGRQLRTAIGLGMQVGADPTLVPLDATGDSLVQWDVHVLGKLEHRNFLGGMRRVSVEDRPRLIYDKPFPATPAPELGNLLIFEFRQPGFVEARTSFVATTRWDRGPDPYGGKFSRSDVLAGGGLERAFLGGKLALSLSLNMNLFLPDAPKTDALTTSVVPGSNLPQYLATYLQYRAILDLRDNPREPHNGAYLGLTVQQAGYFLPSDWNYVRVTPDLRGYFGLPFGMVLAARGRLGLMEISSSDIAIPEADPGRYIERLRDFGPLRQRLRGGGNNSVRGYAPNTLGDVTAVGSRIDSGGLRQWEASLELRVPITANFGAVLFIDVGDVSRDKRFRFRYPQTSLGFGLRYKTLIGPVRLDAGFAPPGLQTIGPDRRARDGYDALGLRDDLGFPSSRPLGVPGALHFTIGEAY